MNQNYIPGGQIFGIINIKLETAETLKEIETKPPFFEFSNWLFPSKNNFWYDSLARKFDKWVKNELLKLIISAKLR